MEVQRKLEFVTRSVEGSPVLLRQRQGILRLLPVHSKRIATITNHGTAEFTRLPVPRAPACLLAVTWKNSVLPLGRTRESHLKRQENTGKERKEIASWLRKGGKRCKPAFPALT